MKRLNSISAVLICLTLLIAFPKAGNAQDSGEAPKLKVSGLAGWFHAGFSTDDKDPLNASIANSGVPVFNDNYLGLGGGGMLIIRNFVVGGEGYSGLQAEAGNENTLIRYATGGGHAIGGYTVIKKKGLILYPAVGIGNYNQTVFMQDMTRDPSFNDLVNDPGAGSELKRNGLMLSGRIGLNYMFSFGETSGNDFFLGVDVGYNYAATASSWRLFGNDVAGGPDIDASGVFVRIKIGYMVLNYQD